MPGTIAYCSREDHVWPSFSACLGRLMARHPDCALVHAIGTNIAESRNAVVRELRGDWLWFVDTDMIFAADTVERLLAQEVPIVQGICLLRHPPHTPILHTASATVRDPAIVGRPRLVDVETVGAGGTLYRREVFDRVPAPWFEGPLGVEDTTFAAKARAAGYRLYCDLATPLGHLTPMAVWPEPDPRGGAWGVRYQSVTGASVSLPAGQPGRVLVPA